MTVPLTSFNHGLLALEVFDGERDDCEAMLHNQWRKAFCSRLASHVSPEMLQRTTNYRGAGPVQGCMADASQ
jgi:hypothetical protein